MKKHVLEKLLHTHNLLRLGDERGYEKFTKMYRPLPHFNPRNDNNHFTNEERTINYSKLRGLFDEVSLGISNAQKFYIPNTTSFITNEERVKVANDVKMMLPYPNTFIQWDKDVEIELLDRDSYGTPQHVSKYEHKRLIYNLWAVDTQHSPVGELPKEIDDMVVDKDNPYTNIVRCMLFVYDPALDDMHVDFTYFDMAWINGGEDYTYWIDDNNIFYDFLDLSADANGEFSNHTLNQQVQICSDILFEYNFLTQFPTVCDVQNIKGMQPANRPSIIESRKFKQSTFNNKPTWEHKVLKLNMYDNASANNKGNNTRSAGTAFHSVRKHLRRLPNGKHTFVKAHFRGSKEVGVVSKEYKIDR